MDDIPTQLSKKYCLKISIKKILLKKFIVKKNL